jgi:hypothetical protein
MPSVMYPSGTHVVFRFLVSMQGQTGPGAGLIGPLTT